MREDRFDSGVTAVLSILKDPYSSYPDAQFPRDSPRVRSRSERYHYSILLWFMGQRVLMPPYLPRIGAFVQAAERADIVDRLERLSNHYQKFYSDHVLSRRESHHILDEVHIVARSIAKYPNQLDGCLRYLGECDLNVTNLIIHTDEHSIPWHLAYSEYRPDWEFLCERYPCGTILVDDCDSVQRFLNQSKRSQQPDVTQKSKKEICLVAGELGQKTADGRDLGVAYVDRLKGFLERFGMPVKCIYPEDWKHCDSRQAVRKLDELFQHAQIVHFTCHVVRDDSGPVGSSPERLKLTDDLRIGPADLNYLSELPSKPLVVLHGCSSAGPAGAGSEGAQLCKAFLFKKAGGCLATVLPVNIPTDISDGAETLLEYFYETVIGLEPYGIALHGARRKFRQRSHAGEDDPQALFYQLFGDPRETLFAPRIVKTYADHIMDAESEEPIPQPLTVRISTEGLDGAELNKNKAQLVTALEKMEGVLKATFQPPAMALGFDSSTPSLVLELLVVSMSVLRQKQIGELVKKTLNLNKSPQIAPSKLPRLP